MRRANTTFVNLRATLDDLDPLVDESKPVARKLRPFLAELRPLARDARADAARPEPRSCARPGAANDLVELHAAQPALRDIAVGAGAGATAPSARARSRPSAKALRGATPELAFLRPYARDLLGWFDDFCHTRHLRRARRRQSRAAPHVSAFALLNGQLCARPAASCAPGRSRPVARAARATAAPARSSRPADGSNPCRPTPDFPCDPTQVLPGRDR